MSVWTNRNEIRIIGMSRSGGHALIQWLMAQMQGRVCYLNCTEGKENPFASARPMEHGRAYRTTIRGFELGAERAGRFAHKDWLLYNHEDVFLRHACSEVHEREHDRWVGPSLARRDLLIVRDPFNLFASRRRACGEAGTTPTALRIWKQHARALLDGRMLRHRPIRIRFDAWAYDAAVRRALAAELGLPFSDAGRCTVARCNGGSSFDRFAFDGAPERMRLRERWRHFAHDPAFAALFDEDIVQLAERAFGLPPGIETLLARRPATRKPASQAPHRAHPAG